MSVVGSSGGVKAHPARRYATGGGYLEGDRGGPEGRTELLGRRPSRRERERERDRERET